MLPGFNHNVRYRGESFHVQTEDHGPRIGRVTTSVFLGGFVVTEVQRPYDTSMATPGGAVEVQNMRAAMQDLHKQTIQRLLDHEFDAIIELFVLEHRPTVSVPPPKDAQEN
jgi:hypothetical protein